MSTTLTPGRVSGNGSSSHTAGITPAKRRQRSLPLAAIAVACMLTAIVAFVGVQLAATDRQPVLAVARPVQAGATITRAGGEDERRHQEQLSLDHVSAGRRR